MKFSMKSGFLYHKKFLWGTIWMFDEIRNLDSKMHKVPHELSMILGYLLQIFMYLLLIHIRNLSNKMQIFAKYPPWNFQKCWLIRHFFKNLFKKGTLGNSNHFCLFSQIYEIFRKFKKEICSRIVGSNFSRHYDIQKLQRCAENRKIHVFRNS